MSAVPASPDSDDPRMVALNVLNMTQDALISVTEFMIADWGKPDEAAKRQAIDALLQKLRRFSEVQQTILTRVAEGGDSGGA